MKSGDWRTEVVQYFLLRGQGFRWSVRPVGLSAYSGLIPALWISLLQVAVSDWITRS